MLLALSIWYTAVALSRQIGEQVPKAWQSGEFLYQLSSNLQPYHNTNTKYISNIMIFFILVELFYL